MTNIEQSYGSTRLYPRLALLAVGLFIVGTNAFVIAGLLPEIADGLGVHVADVGYSITFYAVIVAVAAPTISTFVTRLSRTTLMATALVLIAVGTVISASSTGIGFFTAGRIIAGLGGAALVPSATAAAVAIAPVAKRGSALALVSVGFTAATALGSPIGTALGDLAGWRVPLFGVAGLALVLAVLYALVLRDIPLAPAVPLAQRFTPLRDPRVLATLAAAMFLLAAVNSVYIYSTQIERETTGGSGTVLASLLLIYGVGGFVGTIAAGALTDRLGSRTTVTISLAVLALALLSLPISSGNYAASAVGFLMVGLAGFATVPPIQHRLISIDPATSGIAISWYTTAMYLGIGLAPVLAASALGVGGASRIPVFSAAVLVLAFAAVQLGFVRPRRLRRPREI
jgi:DHA1 family inner membrane transport protein